MAGKVPERIQLGVETDLLQIVEEVHADGIPRLIERNGEPLAAIVAPEDIAAGERPDSEGIARAMKAAGAWRDLDTDALKERIYRARHESPPSHSVRL